MSFAFFFKIALSIVYIHLCMGHNRLYKRNIIDFIRNKREANETLLNNGNNFLNNTKLYAGDYNNCSLVHGDHLYDLSELAERNFWTYSETHHNTGDVVFLLSICHRITDVDNCESGVGNSGVCFTHHQIGSAVSFLSGGTIGSNSVPEYINEGSLKYVYESGSICRKGIINSKYRTILHLRCPFPSDDESFGPILISSPKCDFIFVWMTKAACPKKMVHVNNDPCITKFSNSDYQLNLYALHLNRNYYVKGMGKEEKLNIEMNICGPIINGSCKEENVTICEISDHENPKALATTSGMEIKWTQDVLTMSYKLLNTLDTQNGTIDILLKCDETAHKPLIYYIEDSNDGHKYILKSVALCTPSSRDCVLQDELNTYDLRPLHKSTENWEVIGWKDSDKDVLYHLNLCGPVVRNGNIQCPLGPIGACQTSISRDGAKNLGFITSTPIINRDKSLSVLFTGGDPCNSSMRPSSSLITLYCSKTPFPPIFLELTDSCQHVFEWHTPAACPIYTSTSQSCQVEDPLFGHTFDISSLRNKVQDYVLETPYIGMGGNSTNDIAINICGPLVSSCEGKQGIASICIKEGKHETIAGMAPGSLVFNDGAIIMYFDPRNSTVLDYTYSSKIVFLCDHTQQNLSLVSLSYKDTLEHQFLWRTKHACPPTSEVQCSVTDGDKYYDLSPLSQASFEYKYIWSIIWSPESKRKYILNVCRSVLHSRRNRCPYDAGACAIDIEKKNASINLGRVNSGPYIENGLLKIKYVNGSKCDGDSMYETEIIFKCDHSYAPYSEPTLLSEGKCLVVFEWWSSSACPIVKTIKNDVIGNCTSKNSRTNFVYDMNSLQKQLPYEIPYLNGTILLNICENIKDNRCVDNSGLCLIDNQMNTSLSGGEMSRDLKFEMWGIYLEYENGSLCKNGLHRMTRISFVCQPENKTSEPMLISDDEDNCIFIIHFPTPTACERHFQCAASNWERTVDLSPLIRKDGNYLISNPLNRNETYMINVCHPLNSVEDMDCPGSSSCMLNSSLSLGHPLLSPVLGNRGDVLLMYSHGSSCPGKSGQLMSTSINFTCNRDANLGKPKYLDVTHDCQLRVVWETSLVCEPESEPVGPQCLIKYDEAKTNLDLSSLGKAGGYVVPYGNQTFVINVCLDACQALPGPVHGETCRCENSAACMDGISYGQTDLSELEWDYDSLLLTYYNGSSCDGALSGRRMTKIFFQCDMSAGYGHPQPDSLMSEIPCSALFEWRTNATCLEAIYSPKIPQEITTPTTTNVITSTTPMSLPDVTASNPQISPSLDEVPSGLPIAISVVVVIIVALGVMVYVLRTPSARRLLLEARRSLNRKGDQMLILDDHAMDPVNF